MFSLLAAILASTFMIHIVTISDGSPINDWYYQPTVYLSITYTIANLALQYALTQAITMAWWIKALKEDTSVRDLHNIWALGSGFVNILASPRSFNVVALAGLAVTLAPMNGPLLQRSSVVTERTQSELKNLTIPIALQFPFGYTGYVAGAMASYDPSTITGPFSDILKQYNNRQLINITNVGCQGTCTGKLLGAGYDIQCWNQSIPGSITPNLTRENASKRYDITPFDSSFAYSYNETDNVVIKFNVTYKGESKLEASWTMSQCTLRPATVEYPVLLTNDTITLDPAGSWKTDRTDKFRPVDDVIQWRGPTTHGGMWLYLQSLYTSRMGATYDGVRGWRGWYNGATAFRYVNNVGLWGGGSRFYNGIELSFFDPTSDAMDTVREIAWRAALHIPTENLGLQGVRAPPKNLTRTEWADLYEQQIQVQQTTKQIVYHSQYAYLSIAVTLTLCATFCVLALSFGWWNLGREVSLSPIEIAKAFGAPSLQGTNSNGNVSAILKDLGKERLCYGAAWDSEAPQGPSVATLRFDRAGKCDRPRNTQVLG
jgi:hypothetical protein